MIHGFRTMWPYVEELFRDDALMGRLAEAGIAVAPSSLREEFDPLTAEVRTGQRAVPNPKVD